VRKKKQLDEQELINTKADGGRAYLLWLGF